MYDSVRGQVRRGPGSPHSTRRLQGAPATLAVLVAIGTCLAPAVAQPRKDGGVFRATVSDSRENKQRITVPLHRSVTVDTTVSITRADLIARNIADVQVVSPTRLLVTGQSFGETSIVLTGSDATQYVLEVAVELDLDGFNEAMRSIDPYSTAKAKSMRGNIVLTGTVSSTERAQRMLELAQLYLSTEGSVQTSVQSHLELAGEQQVLLRCVVAEVSRLAARELGVNGFLAGDDFQDMFLVNQLGGINPINIGAAAGAPVNQTIPFLTGEDGIPLSPSTTLSLGFPRVEMQLFLRAMADNRLLRVLAEPNLVAVSGETASFLAGGEFPIPVPQGNQTVTIEFREYGVQLNFTPVVRGQQKIRLQVSPQVSELDFSTAAQFQGFVIPGLTARSTTTTVELGSGQTIAIAGLLNEQIRGVASRIPGFGDLPVLGTLFRSVNFQRSLSELVILVTPEIVSPLEANQVVRLPGDDVKDPSDLELYALGLVEAPHEDESDNDPDLVKEADDDDTAMRGPWGHADTVKTR